ncbi:sensor histidine kinase [Dactylosporangium sp. NPDC005572]|uniref:sensor histidine kinase n=1 Tax=Dactylosporangium sp. NPDC005572 TaxID=3156889 RepID=UPI0033B3B2BB
MRRAVDPALALGFLVALLVERALGGAPMALAAPLALVIAAPLAARRRWPVAAYAVGTAAVAVDALLVGEGTIAPYANIVGLYSAGLYATRRRALLAPPLAVAGIAAYFTRLHPVSAAIPAGVVCFWLLAWALGYLTARRQDDREDARQLLREQVVADERARIARELHDLVGHTLSLMLVQAGAARRVLDTDPAQTRALLGTVEQTGRDALDELDRVLGLLRAGPSGPSEEASGEAPGLADLPRLAERLGRTGLAVRLDVPDSPLPRTLDVSAYRIVQEALTNTVRHAGADTATVTVRRAADALDIEVRDDGRSGPEVYQQGRGLLGIAERAALFGGTAAFERTDPGFRVHVVLPVVLPVQP